MDWKYAARRLSNDLVRVANGSAAVIFAAGWFSNTKESAVFAAAAWILIRTCAYFLDAWTGQAP